MVTSSLAGVTPSPFDPAYSATKHAIIGLVRSLAAGWVYGGSKVTLNAVCPGFVRTPLLPQQAQDQIAAMGYALADPADIAAAVEFIARDGRTGRAWLAQAGQEPQLVEFPRVDLPRSLNRGAAAVVFSDRHRRTWWLLWGLIGELVMNDVGGLTGFGEIITEDGEIAFQSKTM